MADGLGSVEEMLAPGNIITFGDITELATFENVIAGIVNPAYDADSWAARAQLRDLIRPPKFNGTIGNVALTVMDEPYERLVDARERGWRFNSGGTGSLLTNDFSKLSIPRYRGFGLTADAISSGHGVIGQIQTELWYHPLLPRLEARSGAEQTGTRRLKSGEIREYVYTRHKDLVTVLNIDAFGRTLKRVVAKPKLEVERFIKFNETSRRIGFKVLQGEMRNPMTKPMRD